MCHLQYIMFTFLCIQPPVGGWVGLPCMLRVCFVVASVSVYSLSEKDQVLLVCCLVSLHFLLAGLVRGIMHLPERPPPPPPSHGGSRRGKFCIYIKYVSTEVESHSIKIGTKLLNLIFCIPFRDHYFISVLFSNRTFENDICHPFRYKTSGEAVSINIIRSPICCNIFRGGGGGGGGGGYYGCVHSWPTI